MILTPPPVAYYPIEVLMAVMLIPSHCDSCQLFQTNKSVSQFVEYSSKRVETYWRLYANTMITLTSFLPLRLCYLDVTHTKIIYRALNQPVFHTWAFTRVIPSIRGPLLLFPLTLDNSERHRSNVASFGKFLPVYFM